MLNRNKKEKNNVIVSFKYRKRSANKMLPTSKRIALLKVLNSIS